MAHRLSRRTSLWLAVRLLLACCWVLLIYLALSSQRQQCSTRSVQPSYALPENFSVARPAASSRAPHLCTTLSSSCASRPRRPTGIPSTNLLA